MITKKYSHEILDDEFLYMGGKRHVIMGDI